MRAVDAWAQVTNGNQCARSRTSYQRGPWSQSGFSHIVGQFHQPTGSDGCWRYTTGCPSTFSSSPGELVKVTVSPFPIFGFQVGDPLSRTRTSGVRIGLE